MTRPPGDLIETGYGVAYKVENSAASPDLSTWLESFHSYHVRVDPGVAHQELFLPALPSIRMLTYGGDLRMENGGHIFDPVPRVALFGPSANSSTATIGTGHMIGVYLRPAGWALLIGEPADRFTDTIVDLRDFWGSAANDMLAAVNARDTLTAQVEAIEAAVHSRLGPQPKPPAGVLEIEAVIADPEIVTVEQALQRLDMPDWKFARLSRRHFGFTPKVMMRRARFMRTILKIRVGGGKPWAQLVDEAYVDQSHFIRDCRDFLDMTPVQFANRFQPIAKAAFDAREKALGDAHHLVSKPG